MNKLSGKCILVVDDDVDLLDTLIEEFLNHEVTVVGAHNGNEAFKLLLNEKFDIVITDMKMQNGDGLELIQKIHKSEIKPKPIIFLCSGFKPKMTPDLKNMGVIEVFSKPFDWPYIIKTLIASLQKDS